MPGWFKIGDLFNPELTEWRCLERTTGGNHAEYLFHLQRAERSIQVRIIRRSRKTMSLTVERGGEVELRVPLKCAWSDIREFVDDKFDWAVDTADDLKTRPLRPANSYQAGGSVYYLGSALTLVLRKSQFNMVDIEGSELYVSCQDPSKPDVIERQVMSWYRRQAEQVFGKRMTMLNKSFQDEHHPSGLKLRKMKSQWGSCSSSGEICLNLLLIREGLPQIDFVIAHELCHLRHFAHNDAFYRLLTKVMPDWKDQEEKMGRVHF